MSLDGKRALVSGAGSGIGRATAVRMASEGARVALVDCNEETVTALVRQIEAANGVAIPLVADVSIERDVEQALGEVARCWDGLDIVVANAGIEPSDDAPVDSLALEVWERVVATNLTGTFLVAKHGVRTLLASGGGSVILTVSPTSVFGIGPEQHAYSASKGGVLSLSRAMAARYASDGIRVNAVMPGFTKTPANQALLDDEVATAALLRSIPLGRPASPEEVAAFMVFIASDEAGYAVGGVFACDGGMTAI